MGHVLALGPSQAFVIDTQVIMGNEVFWAAVIYRIYTRVALCGVDCICFILGDPVPQYLPECLQCAKSYVAANTVGLAFYCGHQSPSRAMECRCADSKPRYLK